MKNCALGLMLLVLVAGMVLAAGGPGSAALDEGRRLQAAGKVPEAAVCFETAMAEAMGVNMPVAGAAMNHFWEVIRAADNYPLAYEVFGRLLQRLPQVPEVLAGRASAAGGMMSWYGKQPDAGRYSGKFEQLDREARDLYEKALVLDDENFTVLFSYSIYEYYRPGGQAHGRELMEKLKGLREKHPEYPWAGVEKMAGLMK